MRSHHAPIPDTFTRAAVFNRAGAFVRWWPDGVPFSDPEHRRSLRDDEHVAKFQCTRLSLWGPPLPDPEPAEFATTRGVFRIRWYQRRVEVLSPDGVGERIIEVASLPDALAKIQLACAALAAAGHAGPRRSRLTGSRGDGFYGDDDDDTGGAGVLASVSPRPPSTPAPALSAAATTRSDAPCPE